MLKSNSKVWMGVTLTAILAGTVAIAGCSSTPKEEVKSGTETKLQPRRVPRPRLQSSGATSPHRCMTAGAFPLQRALMRTIGGPSG